MTDPSRGGSGGPRHGRPDDESGAPSSEQLSGRRPAQRLDRPTPDRPAPDDEHPRATPPPVAPTSHHLDGSVIGGRPSGPASGSLTVPVVPPAPVRPEPPLTERPGRLTEASTYPTADLGGRPTHGAAQALSRPPAVSPPAPTEAAPVATEATAAAEALTAPTAPPADVPAQAARPAPPRDLAHVESRAALRARAYAQQRAQAEAQAEARALAQTATQRRPEQVAQAATDADDEATAKGATAASTTAPSSRRPQRPWQRPRQESAWGVHVGQVMTWEVAAASTAFAVPQPLPTLIPVCSAAAIAVGLTAIKVRRRWLYQWVALWLRFRTRRRRRPVEVSDEPDGAGAPGLLATIARGAEVATMEVDDAPVALLSHAGGFTALLEPVSASPDQLIDAVRALPALPDILPPHEAGEPVLSAQVVVHTIPAPALSSAEDSAAVSYRELSGGTVPAVRRCLIAIQALHTAQDFEDVDLRAAVVNAATRLQRRLTKSGLRGHLLNPEDAVAQFAALARLGDGRVASESWRTWSAGAHLHTTFRVVDWPDLADGGAARLVDRLASIPTSATTVAIAVRRNGPDFELESAVRVTVPSADASARAVADLTTAASEAGARLQRLDGEQLFGVAASMPLGGFLS